MTMCIECGNHLNACICDTGEPGISHDEVNHPAHYTTAQIECIQVIEELGLNYNLGNALKYIWRSGRKNDAVLDLEKGRWYLDREIERLRGADHE